MDAVVTAVAEHAKNTGSKDKQSALSLSQTPSISKAAVHE
jgi:hypothetical protein